LLSWFTRIAFGALRAWFTRIAFGAWLSGYARFSFGPRQALQIQKLLMEFPEPDCQFVLQFHQPLIQGVKT
jgi:hypothetical protein